MHNVNVVFVGAFYGIPSGRNVGKVVLWNSISEIKNFVSFLVYNRTFDLLQQYNICSMSTLNYESQAEFKRDYPQVPEWAVAFFNEMKSLKTSVDRVEAKVDLNRTLAKEAKQLGEENKSRIEELESKIDILEKRMADQEDYLL